VWEDFHERKRSALPRPRMRLNPREIEDRTSLKNLGFEGVEIRKGEKIGRKKETEEDKGMYERSVLKQCRSGISGKWNPKSYGRNQKYIRYIYQIREPIR